MTAKMIQLKEEDIEEAKSTLIEAKQLMKQRQMFIAGQKIMEVHDILLKAKDAEEEIKELKSFLLSREHDIAIDLEDFGSLKNTFQMLIGRTPKEEDS